MKSWLLFVFDLAVAACAVRAGYLIYSAKKAGTGSELMAAKWNISEAGGWLVGGCVLGFAALLAAIIPG